MVGLLRRKSPVLDYSLKLNGLPSLRIFSGTFALHFSRNFKSSFRSLRSSGSMCGIPSIVRYHLLHLGMLQGTLRSPSSSETSSRLKNSYDGSLIAVITFTQLFMLFWSYAGFMRIQSALNPRRAERRLAILRVITEALPLVGGTRRSVPSDRHQCSIKVDTQMREET